MPRPKKSEDPSEPDPKYASWILAAIAKVRHQKQRPNEERITHILEITYGVDPVTVAEQLELCVKSGRIIRGDFKGKSSYKDPSVVTPGASKSPRMPSDLTKIIKKAIKNEGTVQLHSSLRQGTVFCKRYELEVILKVRTLQSSGQFI